MPETIATREFVKDEIDNLRVELRGCKSEILRRMFIYWVGIIVVCFGSMIAFIKFFQ